MAISPSCIRSAPAHTDLSRLRVIAAHPITLVGAQLGVSCSGVRAWVLCQFALNVISQITSSNPEETLLRVGFCKIGASLHAGHDSGSGVVRNAKNDSNFLRRIEMIGFDLNATEASLPALLIFARSSGQLIVDVMPDLRQIRLIPSMRLPGSDRIQYAYIVR